MQYILSCDHIKIYIYVFNIPRDYMHTILRFLPRATGFVVLWIEENISLIKEASRIFERRVAEWERKATARKRGREKMR